MENLAHRDVTGEPRRSTVVPFISLEVQNRELKACPPRPDFGKPVHVRSVAQMLAYAQHVARNPHVVEQGMIADPGLGKSTIFPMMLAKRAGKMVILLEFCTGLAECVFEGLKNARAVSAEYKSVELTCVGQENDATFEFNSTPNPHVVVVSARRLLRRIAMGFSFAPAIVIHDESHYSDYAAYTWRQVAAEFPWAEVRIALSATISPSIVSENTALDGKKFSRTVVERDVPPVSTWAELTGFEAAEAPWAVEVLKTTKTLVFSDDRSANVAHGKVLKKAGIPVLHLWVGENSKNVKAALEALRSSEAAVVFADASYRNGYNMDVDTVIDCGYVREEYIADGRVWERYRLANRVEIMQGAARVGRSRTGKVYRHAADYPSHVPVLALGEVRHAAATMMVLGFQPAKVLGELVPEVLRWDVTTAARMVHRSLDAILASEGSVTSVEERRSRKEVSNADAAKETEPVVGLTGTGPKSSGLSVMDILDKAQSFSLGPRGVDEAFPLNHPGARYYVPSDFCRIPDPYWVSSVNAVKMMRKLVSGDGNYDVMMLSEREAQWFAHHLTRAWNHTADDIVDGSMILAAVGEIPDANASMHGHVLTRVHTTRREVAMLVRQLEDVMSLMRALYRDKPFAVKCEDISGDQGLRARYDSNRRTAAMSCVGRISSTHSVVSSTGPLHWRQAVSTDPVPYAWQSTPTLSRNRVRIADGTVSSEHLNSDT